MRRILFSILLVVAFAAAYAGPDQVVLQIDNCWTGTVQTVRETESIPVYGYVDQIDIICKNSTTTGTVEICTVTNDWYDIETAILTATAISASAAYRPRTHGNTWAGNVTNTSERVLLYGQKLKLQAYSFIATNNNIAVRIKLNTE